MPALNVRNLSEETHRALRVRAAENGHSMEAEVRAIIEAAVQPKERIKLGSLLAAIGAKCGGVDLGVTRDKTPIEPASFD
jgi:plasmid stability protein